MEQKLWSVSKNNYGKSVQSATGSIQKLFNKRAKKFDGKLPKRSVHFSQISNQKIDFLGLIGRMALIIQK